MEWSDVCAEQEPYAPFLSGDVRSGSKACCIFNESLTYSAPPSHYPSCQCRLVFTLTWMALPVRTENRQCHSASQMLSKKLHRAHTLLRGRHHLQQRRVCVWVSIPAANPALNETLYSQVLTLFIMALFPLWHLIDRYNGFYRLFISLLQQWINTTSSHAWLTRVPGVCSRAYWFVSVNSHFVSVSPHTCIRLSKWMRDMFSNHAIDQMWSAPSYSH